MPGAARIINIIAVRIARMRPEIFTVSVTAPPRQNIHNSDSHSKTTNAAYRQAMERFVNI